MHFDVKRGKAVGSQLVFIHGRFISRYSDDFHSTISFFCSPVCKILSFFFLLFVFFFFFQRLSRQNGCCFYIRTASGITIVSCIFSFLFLSTERILPFLWVRGKIKRTCCCQSQVSIENHGKNCRNEQKSWN